MAPPAPQDRASFRILSPTLAFLLRIANVLSLLLAAIVILVAIDTSSRPLEISRPELQVHDGIQFDIARGHIWILSLQTYFRDVPPRRAPAPRFWTVTRIDRNWDKHLTPTQTGPIRFGFASHLRHAERVLPVIDPATGRREEKTFVEDERITRLPLIALIVALLLLPAITLILRIVRPNRTADDRPSIIITLLRSLLATAAIASLCLLKFALWNVLFLGSSTTCSWHTSWDDSTARTREHRFQRSITLARDGWHVQHLDDNANVPVSGEASHTFSIDTLRPYESSSLRSAIDSAPSHAGFRYAMSSTVFPGYGALQRGTEWTLLIPHWAILLTLAIAPAAWLYLRLLPRLRRRHRQRHHLCQQCGYDLRGSSNQCPECGAPVTPVAQVPATESQEA